MTIAAPAEPAHAEEISALAEEMDRFYGAIEIAPRDIRIRQINESLFSDPPTVPRDIRMERSAPRRHGDLLFSLACGQCD